MGFDVYGLNPTIKEGSVKPTIDWEANPSEEEKKAYFEAQEKYEEENVGEYFRNNIWWWRLLAKYVYDFTGEIAEKDYDSWHFNDGHQVDEDTAIRIANSLDALIKKGHTAKREKEVNEAIKGGKWSENYPFSVENVQRFANFCRQSGGFEIC